VDDDARRAARRLYWLAAVMRVAGTIVLGAVGLVGVAVAALVDGKSLKIAGVATALGSLFAWLMLALVCAAAQAIACYIEARAR